MRFDIDLYREILDTLTRNKSRSLLTGFGVFWGVFMLIFLIGGGGGVKELLAKNFDGFAHNTTLVFAQNTTKAYDGFRKGRYWSMTDTDVERLRHQVPEIETISPMVFGSSMTVTYGDRKSSGSIAGCRPDYAKVETPKIYYGRYINAMDEEKGRKVCVIGKRIYKELFGGGMDPCGKRIKVGNIYYQIIGVDYNSTSIGIGGDAETKITIPFNVCRKMYSYGNNVHTIAMTINSSRSTADMDAKIRGIVARNHHIDPTDEHGVALFNTSVIFGIMDSLFQGVTFLILLIGIGTILAGAIGVSNIMMVTVKERTVEIGIRRAIGATPRMILSQILTESLLLTIVAGMSGIMFGIITLQALEMYNTTDGIVEAHFQVDFWTATAAATGLSFLGMLAGLAPAFRAMAIKPVDAMRDE